MKKKYKAWPWMLASIFFFFFSSCSTDSLTCDPKTFIPECKNSTQRSICTHGEEALEECVSGFECRFVESADEAQCVKKTMESSK